MMNFVELKVSVQPEFSDIMVAELAELGYDSFVDTEEGVAAYVSEELFDEEGVKEVVKRYEDVTALAYVFTTIKKKNWNEEWEKGYSPIVVEDKVLVRATFHPADSRYPYQIIITPKMSFGTGHHETTALMLANQLLVNHQYKRVLDVGCGTGILAIMAFLLGANDVMAFDIDEWAVENTRENVLLNGCENMAVEQGKIEDIQLDEQYDVVLANINRNVLLQDVPAYAALLPYEGTLIVSGFYEQDVKDIENIAQQSGLTKVSQKEKNNWVSIIFRKN